MRMIRRDMGLYPPVRQTLFFYGLIHTWLLFAWAHVICSAHSWAHLRVWGSWFSISLCIWRDAMLTLNLARKYHCMYGKLGLILNSDSIWYVDKSHIRAVQVERYMGRQMEGENVINLTFLNLISWQLIYIASAIVRFYYLLFFFLKYSYLGFLDFSFNLDFHQIDGKKKIDHKEGKVVEIMISNKFCKKKMWLLYIYR